jgi:hypothetical protein
VYPELKKRLRNNNNSAEDSEPTTMSEEETMEVKSQLLRKKAEVIKNIDLFIKKFD